MEMGICRASSGWGYEIWESERLKSDILLLCYVALVLLALSLIEKRCA